MINKIFAGDFYDNATALLVVLFAKLQVLKITKRLNTSEHVVKIPYSVIETWDLSDEMTAYESLRKYMNVGAHAATIGSEDLSVLNKTDALVAWFKAHSKRFITDQNTKRVNPAFEDDEYIMTFKVWTMYDYDDGHSKSGHKYGEHFGFRHGRFVVPEDYDLCTPGGSKLIEPIKYSIPNTESEIIGTTSAAAFINCSGLSPQEVLYLDKALRGNKRQTPLLIDQTLTFEFGTSSVKGLHCQDHAKEPFRVTDDFVGELITKLVTNHKWYEDALCAQRALRYWLAQPANETVESHWWTHLERRLSLPALGLKRAAMGILLLDEGVCNSLESLQHHTELMRNNDNMLTESLMANTAWYWGEFLSIYNAPNLDHILQRLHMGTSNVLNPMQRADALYSAVIGRAVPRTIYNELSTYLSCGLKSIYSKTIMFGKMQFDHLPDYGYTTDVERIMLNTLVAPSGTALITGLAGPLVMNTPYAAIFNINSSNKKTYKFEVFDALNYQDLWGVGVVSRWQGYDVRYWHPKRTGTHKTYAANNVSLAQPPVTPSGLDESLSYLVEGFTRRGYHFGTNYEKLLSCDTTFMWTRDCSQFQTDYDYEARPCGEDRRQFIMPKFFKQVLTDTEKYPANILAEYDYTGPSFHITELDVPVILPQNTEQLLHTDVPIEIDNVPNTAIGEQKSVT